MNRNVKRILFPLLSLLCTTGANAQDSTLRHELLRMEKEDQAIRTELIASMKGTTTIDTALALRMNAADSLRTVRLEQIIAATGWPTREQVGVGGVHAAFMVLQHSPDFTLQERMLPTLDSLGKLEEISQQDVAMLTDRVLVHKNQPQIYGTQLDGNFKEFPIEDEQHVDERRAKMGMMPLATYLELVKAYYKQKK